MSSPLSKQVSAPEICDSSCIKKFEILLDSKFSAVKMTNPSTTIVLKMDLQRTGIDKPIHVEVYSNNKINIKASPALGPAFNPLCNEIESLLKESTNITSRNEASIRINRAKKILSYVHNLNQTIEDERMVIVILCDIILDLIVSEKLSNVGGTKSEQDDESVWKKLDLLKNRYNATPYKTKPIQDIRDLRNKIAHGGSPIIESEAAYSRNSTEEIFALF